MSSHTDFATSTFRSLVDEALRSQALDGEPDVVDRFGSLFQDVQPARRWEKLYVAISKAVCVPMPGKSAAAVLRRLKRSIVYEEALGPSPEPYAGILRTLADACREGAARPFSDRESWLEAILAAKSVRILNGDLPPDPAGREAVVLAAAKRLGNGGTKCRVEEGRFEIDPTDFVKLTASLDRQVAALGGLPVVEQVIAYLVDVEPLEFGRYAPGRVFAQGRTQPSCPIGYLMQLGVKHLDSAPAISSVRPQLWQDLVKRAIDLCALLDVEPYDNLEDIILDGNDVPHYLASVALFDHLFALKQWPPPIAGELLRRVTAKLDPKEVAARAGWTLDDVLLALSAVLEVAKEPFAIVTPGRLQQAGLPRATWLALRPDFVHCLRGVNQHYLSPLDADKAEFDFKPLFALPKDNLLVVTPGLACLGFYEATTRILRSAKYPKLDAILGETVEDVAADALRSAGLNVSIQGVEYVAEGGSRSEPSGECDVVVETDAYVVFIELKKKPLRRISGTGDAAPGLVDLSTSLFAAQGQLARHEQVLLREGELNFVNGYSLKLAGRRIERIAMTWLDYGGLQDKYLLSQVFTALLGRRVTTDHPKEGAKLGELNSAIEALEKEVAALRDMGKDENAPFMNCWFLSVPQLMMFLDGVSGPSDFEQRLGRLRHITYRTLDFYRDFGFARRSKLV